MTIFGGIHHSQVYLHSVDSIIGNTTPRIARPGSHLVHRQHAAVKKHSRQICISCGGQTEESANIFIPYQRTLQVNNEPHSGNRPKKRPEADIMQNQQERKIRAITLIGGLCLKLHSHAGEIHPGNSWIHSIYEWSLFLIHTENVC